MLGYGAIEAWVGNMNYDNPTKRRVCGANLCPEEFWDNRTFTLLQQSAAGSSAQLLPEFQRALRSDSASSYAWANLAEAERDAGHPTQAKYCFQKGFGSWTRKSRHPVSSSELCLLQLGDKAETMRDLSVVLRNPELPNYYQSVFLTYSRLGTPMGELLNEGVPALSTAAEPFLQFWMEDKKIPQAQATWNWMLRHSLTNEKSIGDYTSFLVANHEIAAAAEEWRRGNPKNGIPLPGIELDVQRQALKRSRNRARSIGILRAHRMWKRHACRTFRATASGL